MSYLVEYVKNLTMHLQFAVVERKRGLLHFLWGVSFSVQECCCHFPLTFLLEERTFDLSVVLYMFLMSIMICTAYGRQYHLQFCQIQALNMVRISHHKTSFCKT